MKALDRFRRWSVLVAIVVPAFVGSAPSLPGSVVDPALIPKDVHRESTVAGAMRCQIWIKARNTLSEDVWILFSQSVVYDYTGLPIWNSKFDDLEDARIPPGGRLTVFTHRAGNCRDLLLGFYVRRGSIHTPIGTIAGAENGYISRKTMVGESQVGITWEKQGATAYRLEVDLGESACWAAAAQLGYPFGYVQNDEAAIGCDPPEPTEELTDEPEGDPDDVAEHDPRPQPEGGAGDPDSDAGNAKPRAEGDPSEGGPEDEDGSGDSEDPEDLAVVVGSGSGGGAGGVPSSSGGAAGDDPPVPSGGSGGRGVASGPELPPAPSGGGGGGRGGTPVPLPGNPSDPPPAGGRGDREGGVGGPVPGGHARLDVHMRTLDGGRYDLQAAGEFVAARSRDGDLEVQLRMEPWKGSDRVSVNTAAAAKIGSDRVSIRLSGSVPIVRLNGEPVGVERGRQRSLEGGGRIAAGDQEIVLTWPDGSTMTVQPHASFLDVYLTPAETRRGTLAGLMGDFDGDPSDDFVTSGGKQLELPLRFEALYEELATSWRVRQAESLFDYGPGENTETFTNPKFPSRAATAQSLSAADRRRAEEACRENGITHPDVLEECIVDVGHSGDLIFATAAVAAQRREEAAHARSRRSPLGPEPVVSGLCQPSTSAAATASYGGDVGHTGRFEDTLRRFEAQRQWSVSGLYAGHDPLVVGERVIGAKERRLVALGTETGRILWEAGGTTGRIAGRGLVAAGGVVFAAWDEALAAYDLEQGTECWRLPIGRGTSPAFADGRVFVSVDEGESGYLAAIDARSGRIVWRYDARTVAAANWSNPSAPTVGAGSAFVADGKDVVSLDAASGEVRWRASTGRGITNELSYANGVVYVPDKSHGVYAIDAETGGTLWVWTETGLDLANPVSVSEDHVYVADARHLHALDRRSGLELWKIDAERAVRFNAPSVIGDRLYAITHDGELVILAAGTGDEIRRVKVGRGFGWSVPVPSRGNLYFLLPNGRLNAYR